ncbi:hypothetical protein T492DRAFT_867309 [Pavlovales sp. CCMP2436]|nr:hypothetical protein T492DRAFT_867309 [Pavlovales sp. CCMP2436]
MEPTPMRARRVSAAADYGPRRVSAVRGPSAPAAVGIRLRRVSAAAAPREGQPSTLYDLAAAFCAAHDGREGRNGAGNYHRRGSLREAEADRATRRKLIGHQLIATRLAQIAHALGSAASDSSAEEARAIARWDWLEDTADAPRAVRVAGIDLAFFCATIFELCDTWTEGSDVESYATFLSRLFRRIIRVSQEGALDAFSRYRSQAPLGKWSLNRGLASAPRCFRAIEAVLADRDEPTGGGDSSREGEGGTGVGPRLHEAAQLARTHTMRQNGLVTQNVEDASLAPTVEAPEALCETLCNALMEVDDWGGLLDSIDNADCLEAIVDFEAISDFNRSLTLAAVAAAAATAAADGGQTADGLAWRRLGNSFTLLGAAGLVPDRARQRALDDSLAGRTQQDIPGAPASVPFVGGAPSATSVFLGLGSDLEQMGGGLLAGYGIIAGLRPRMPLRNALQDQLDFDSREENGLPAAAVSAVSAISANSANFATAATAGLDTFSTSDRREPGFSLRFFLWC